MRPRGPNALGLLMRLTQGVTELRNQVGAGRGRESVLAWVRPRHAGLAAGAVTTWCNLILETLGDPEALGVPNNLAAQPYP